MSSNLYDFTAAKIHDMKYSPLWQGTIITNAIHSQPDKKPKNPNKDEPEATYKLYATGDADLLRGRIYVSLPSDLVITDEIKRQYNILM